MPELVQPDPRFHRSFLRAMAAFAAEGRGGSADLSNVGRDLREWAPRWEDPAVFAAYTAAVRAQALEATPRAKSFVPCTTLWWGDGPEYLGRIQLRQRLTAMLLETGGHIGYDVAPEHRRRGHATAMLRAMLPFVRAQYDLDSVLITCDTDNVASRKVIEGCGGVYEDTRRGKLRYWVPTD